MLVTISSGLSVRVIVAVEWADDELGSGARAPDKLHGSGELATGPGATQIEEPSRAEYGDRLRELAEREFGGSGYWREVPRLEREAAELRGRHELDKPAAPDARPHAKDVSGAIEGIWRSEPKITADVCGVAADGAHSMWLEGLDCRLKGEQRLREKIEHTARGNLDASPGQVARDIPDAIRYTFCADAPRYTDGFRDVCQQLEERGYHMYQCKNLWDKQEYKGVNSRWITPDGQRFEVQFHTPESFHAKQHLTHWAYEQLRSTIENIARAERLELKAFQRHVASCIETPERADEIPDFKEDQT
jgi:hypothetical protein